MKFQLALSLILIYLSSCSKTKVENIQGLEYVVSAVESSDNFLIEAKDFTGVIFSDQVISFSDVFTFRMRWKPKEAEAFTPFTPSLKEVLVAEAIMKRCVEVDKTGVDSMQIWDGAIKKLSLYNRQYFGGINNKGQKLIWINCFYRKSDFKNFDWKTKEVSVTDGGGWFFRIVTNIDTKECYGFRRNSNGG